MFKWVSLGLFGGADAAEAEQSSAGSMVLDAGMVSPSAHFLKALTEGKHQKYTQKRFSDQVQYVSPLTMAVLINQGTYKTFCWVLKKKQFDLENKVQFENEPHPLSLLDRAIISQNEQCVRSLLLHDIRSALWVLPSTLRDIDGDTWRKIYDAINTGEADPGVKLAIEHLNLKRTTPDDKALPVQAEALELLWTERKMENGVEPQDEDDNYFGVPSGGGGAAAP